MTMIIGTIASSRLKSAASFDGLGVITTTGQSYLEFTFPPTDYIAYQMRFMYVPSASNSFPQLRLNNRTGSNNYTYALGYIAPSVNGAVTTGNNAANYPLLSNSYNLATNECVSGVVDVYNPYSSTELPQIRTETSFINNTSTNWEVAKSAGGFFYINQSSSRISRIGLAVANGTMSTVSLSLYGVKG